MGGSVCGRVRLRVCAVVRECAWVCSYPGQYGGCVLVPVYGVQQWKPRETDGSVQQLLAERVRPGGEISNLAWGSPGLRGRGGCKRQVWELSRGHSAHSAPCSPSAAVGRSGCVARPLPVLPGDYQQSVSQPVSPIHQSSVSVWQSRTGRQHLPTRLACLHVQQFGFQSGQFSLDVGLKTCQQLHLLLASMAQCPWATL